MGSFWKNKRGEPVYSHWYYNVEFFGITYSFLEIENLRNFRDKIAGQKLGSPFGWYRRNRMSSPLNRFYRRNGIAFLKFRLRESYILFRHQKEIIGIFDRAYESFRAEQIDEEAEPESNRDWR
jgi:hypothetical protein